MFTNHRYDTGGIGIDPDTDPDPDPDPEGMNPLER
jgi:hypothetical protein